MSSINDALRRARQMNEASKKGSSPVQQTPTFIEKRRSKAPLAGFLIVAVVLAGVIGWFIFQPEEPKVPVAEKSRSSTEVKPAGEQVRPTPEEAKTRVAASSIPPGDKPVKQVKPLKTAVLAKKTSKVTPTPVKAGDRLPQKPVTKKHAALKKPIIIPKKPRQTLKAPSGRAEVRRKAAASEARPKASALTTSSTPEGRKPSPKLMRPELAALDHFKLGREAQKNGRYSQAVFEYRQALRLDPNLTQAYLNLGNIFFYHDKTLGKAREMYSRVLKIDPDNKLGHNNLGVIFLKRNLFDQAEAEFAAALKLDPAFADASYNMACLYAKKGMKSKAVAHLLKAAQINPAVRRWAAGDTDFQNLADLPEFERFLRQAGSGGHKAGKQ